MEEKLADVLLDESPAVEQNTTEELPPADGTVLIQMYQVEGGTKVGVITYDRHNNNKPLQMPHMIMALAELQNYVFAMFRRDSSPENRVLKDIDMLCDASSLLLNNMFMDYMKRNAPAEMTEESHVVN